MSPLYEIIVTPIHVDRNRQWNSWAPACSAIVLVAAAVGYYALTSGLISRASEKSRGAGKGIFKVAREIGVGTGTVQRIKEEMTDPFVGAAA